MQSAIDRGPHKSALHPDAIAQLHDEVAAKVRAKQAHIVDWNDIKHKPPAQLKVSPITMVPHKSRKFRTILDLSFSIHLQDGSLVPSVNKGTKKLAPKGALDQMGHSLSRIIHAFASASADERVFMTKWDIKDGFWRLNCAEGEEWNFAYVLPESTGPSTKLVVPNSLQMGWIESPPYFCTALETGHDIAEWYTETPVGALLEHKFLQYTRSSPAYAAIPLMQPSPASPFQYLIEVYMDDYIGLVMATAQDQPDCLAGSVMHAIHDIFPPDELDENDPISLKKLLQREG
jgi:hypothetical protein